MVSHSPYRPHPHICVGDVIRTSKNSTWHLNCLIRLGPVPINCIGYKENVEGHNARVGNTEGAIGTPS